MRKETGKTFRERTSQIGNHNLNVELPVADHYPDPVQRNAGEASTSKALWLSVSIRNGEADRTVIFCQLYLGAGLSLMPLLNPTSVRYKNRH